jgi:hypothetical protein
MFSTVRGYVLQDATAHNYAAKPAGFWDCRNLVPIEKAKSVLGEGYFYQNRQHSWIGDGGFMMHDIVEGGKLVHCVISGVETSPPSDRKSRLSKERLTNLFNGWLDGPIAPGMIEVSFIPAIYREENSTNPPSNSSYVSSLAWIVILNGSTSQLPLMRMAAAVSLVMQHTLHHHGKAPVRDWPLRMPWSLAVFLVTYQPQMILMLRSRRLMR